MKLPPIPEQIAGDLEQRTEQGRTFTAPTPQWQTEALRFRQLVSGVVSVLPLGAPTAPADPQIVGSVVVVTRSAGGGDVRRIVSIPRWGALVGVPAGVTTVNATLYLPGATWNVSAQPARHGSVWQLGDPIDLGPGGSIAVEPPAYATRCTVTVITGSCSLFDLAGPAVGPFNTFTVAATPGEFLAGAAGARISIAWEV